MGSFFLILRICLLSLRKCNFCYTAPGNLHKSIKNVCHKNALCHSFSKVCITTILCLEPYRLWCYRSVLYRAVSKNWKKVTMSYIHRCFLTFPLGFWIPIIFSNLNLNCSNVLDLRSLQELIKKAFCLKISCLSDIKSFLDHKNNFFSQ